MTDEERKANNAIQEYQKVRDDCQSRRKRLTALEDICDELEIAAQQLQKETKLQRQELKELEQLEGSLKIVVEVLQEEGTQ